MSQFPVLFHSMTLILKFIYLKADKDVCEQVGEQTSSVESVPSHKKGLTNYLIRFLTENRIICQLAQKELIRLFVSLPDNF